MSILRRLTSLVFVFVVVGAVTANADQHEPRVSGKPERYADPVVISLQNAPVAHVLAIVKHLYPGIRVTADRSTAALVVEAPAAELQAIRSVIANLDVKGPDTTSVEAIALTTSSANALATKLQQLYRASQIVALDQRHLLVRATAIDMQQIKAVIASIDTPVPATSAMPSAKEAFTVSQASPRELAKVVSRQFPRLGVALSGTAIVLSGPPDDIEKAKALIPELDVAAPDAVVTSVVRLRVVDPRVAADALHAVYPKAEVRVEADLNALIVTAPSGVQKKIADIVKGLDQTETPTAPAGGAVVGATANDGYEVYTIRSTIPGQSGGGGPVAAGDPSNAVIQTLQQLVPSVRVAQLAGVGQIALIGDPFTLRAARKALASIDVSPPLVVLDTQILEIDESSAKNLGLVLAPPLIGTQFSEIAPFSDGTSTARLGRLQAFTRTPLTIGAQLNLLVQKGEARVLADPRITTLSGHTATIRAGDTINILTTTGGGTGTIATTQLQAFQTGVSLDITPVVTDDHEVTVNLHPVVNSLSGLNNGVPQIATRDTQTVVHLKDNETLVIGGLIQESRQHSQDKIPLLGDLPLIGRAFRNDQTSSSRNELVIVVTPHLVRDEDRAPAIALMPIPTPQPLSTSLRSRLAPAQRPASAKLEQRTATTVAASPTPTVSAPVQASAEPVHEDVQTYFFGRRPVTNVAGPNDQPKVFYVEAVPTVVSNGTPVKIAVITTTNVSSVAVGYGTISATLTQGSPGIWTGAFPFSTSAIVPKSSQVQITVKASRNDGVVASHSFYLRLSEP